MDINVYSISVYHQTNDGYTKNIQSIWGIDDLADFDPLHFYVYNISVSFRMRVSHNLAKNGDLTLWPRGEKRQIS